MDTGEQVSAEQIGVAGVGKMTRIGGEVRGHLLDRWITTVKGTGEVGTWLEGGKQRPDVTLAHIREG